MRFIKWIKSLWYDGELTATIKDKDTFIGYVYKIDKYTIGQKIEVPISYSINNPFKTSLIEKQND